MKKFGKFTVITIHLHKITEILSFIQNCNIYNNKK